MTSWRRKDGRDLVGSPRQNSFPRPKYQEDGFTLLELIIVLVLIPIVIAGISAAIITSLKDQTDVSSRLADSQDAQLASAYLVPDIQSATSVNNALGQPSCQGFLNPKVAGTPLLQLAESNLTNVYYLTGTLPSFGANAIVRVVCNSFNPVPDPVNAITVVSHIPLPLFITVSCVFPLPANASCTPGRGGSGSNGGVASVSFFGTEPNGFSYSLSATPRVPSPAPPISGVMPPLLLLGSAASIQFSNPGQSLQVTGDIDINSHTKPSVVLPSIGNDTITSSGGTFHIFKCNSNRPSGGICSNKTVSGVGTITPTPKSVPNTVGDPLSGLAIPPAVTSPVQTKCSGGDPTLSSQPPILCPPGFYPGGLTISGSSDTVTFIGGGNYQFGTSGCTPPTCVGLAISGTGNQVTFDSANYTFEGSTANTNSCTNSGLSQPGSGGLDVSGSGNALNSGSGGVFLYVAGGPTNFGCGSIGNAVSLAAMAPSQTNPGVLLFHDGNDPQPLVLTGSNVATPGNAYAGIIYAPTDQVQCLGFGQSIQTGAIDAASFSEPFAIATAVAIQP
jgi:prepilin-type N-terminal cleavage/methylation domain-containing protein